MLNDIALVKALFSNVILCTNVVKESCCVGNVTAVKILVAVFIIEIVKVATRDVSIVIAVVTFVKKVDD